MLEHNHLSEYFYMDMLFVVSKTKKSTRSNTCAQLFVTNKEHTYDVPMIIIRQCDSTVDISG